MAQNNKTNRTILYLLIGAIILMIIFNSKPRQNTYVGMVTPLSVTTVNGLTYTIYPDNGYDKQAGCESYSCGDVGCNPTTVALTPIAGCNVNRCTTFHWDTCRTQTCTNICRYGSKECTYPDPDFCGNRGNTACQCEWVSEVHVVGGPTYEPKNGCAFYVEVKDSTGAVVARYDQANYNAGWSGDPQLPALNYLLLHEDIGPIGSETHFEFHDYIFNSNSNGCEGMLFKVIDSANSYRICFGHTFPEGWDKFFCDSASNPNQDAIVVTPLKVCNKPIDTNQNCVIESSEWSAWITNRWLPGVDTFTIMVDYGNIYWVNHVSTCGLLRCY